MPQQALVRDAAARLATRHSAVGALRDSYGAVGSVRRTVAMLHAVGMPASPAAVLGHQTNIRSDAPFWRSSRDRRS
jgi:hypothetical protein